MKARKTATLLIAAAVAATTPCGLIAQEPRLEVEESPGSRSVYERHRDHGSHGGPSHGYLGVALTTMTPELREHFGAPAGSGVLVSRVEAGSAAASAGLRVGDVITALDGRELDSVRDAERWVRSAAGETVDVELYREGRRLEVRVTLAERERHRHSERRHHRSHHDWDDDLDFGGLAAEMAELGIEMGVLGADIGLSVAEAMAGIDWEAIGHTVEDSVELSINAVDWDEIGEQIERSMRSLEGLEIDVDSREIERALEKLERALEDLELEITVDRN